jgi:uncharacterized protein YjcR
MAKANKTKEIVEVEEVEETTETTMRPKDLAVELEIDPKTLRAWLRREFPREATAKNTSWALTQAQVDAARDHFTSDEDDEEVEDEA